MLQHSQTIQTCAEMLRWNNYDRKIRETYTRGTICYIGIKCNKRKYFSVCTNSNFGESGTPIKEFKHESDQLKNVAKKGMDANL